MAAGVPGVTAVIRDGGSTSRVASGVGEVASNTPIRVDDRFRTGRLSKTYVPVVVLQLADEGKLALKDSIERWLPRVVPGGGAITVRQLLNHRSGIANYEEHPDPPAEATRFVVIRRSGASRSGWRSRFPRARSGPCR